MISNATWRELCGNAVFLGKAAISIGFVIWAIRKRGEFDQPLSRQGQIFRFAVVFVCWIGASIPMRPFGWVQIAFAAVGFAVLWWPNVVYRLSARYRGTDENTA